MIDHGNGGTSSSGFPRHSAPPYNSQQNQQQFQSNHHHHLQTKQSSSSANASKRGSSKPHKNDQNAALNQLYNQQIANNNVGSIRSSQSQQWLNNQHSHQQQFTSSSGQKTTASGLLTSNHKGGAQTTNTTNSTSKMKSDKDKVVNLQAKFASLLKMTKDHVFQQQLLMQKDMGGNMSSSGTKKSQQTQQQALSTEAARNQLFAVKGAPETTTNSSTKAKNNQRTQSPLVTQTQAIKNDMMTGFKPVDSNGRITAIATTSQQFQSAMPLRQANSMQQQIAASGTASGGNSLHHHSSNMLISQTPVNMLHQQQQIVHNSHYPQSSTNRKKKPRGSGLLKSAVAGSAASVAAGSLAATVQSQHAALMASTMQQDGMLAHQFGSGTGQVRRGTSSNSTAKSTKKKKQQPSQQQVNLVIVEPAVEEYHAVNSRLQQNQQLMQKPSQHSSSMTYQPTISTPSHSSQNLHESARNSSQIMGGQSPHHHQQQQQPIEALESQLLAQFKTKCQQEMHSQVKQAVAKILYTKREVLMEIKSQKSVVAAANVEAEKIQQTQQRSEPKESQIDLASIEEAIKSQLEKVQKAMRDGIYEKVEARIDHILEQIQTVIQGMEDQLYTKVGKIESDIVDLTQGVSSLVEDSEKAEEAHKMAGQALESIKKLKTKSDTKISTQNDLMKVELEKLQKTIEVIAAQDKQQTQRIEEFSDDLTSRLQAQSRKQEQMMQSNFEQLQTSTVQQIKDLESFTASVKDEAQQMIQRSLIEREATIETKLEETKQQLYKAINGNMRILDNLISDYTTRTHDQIKQQLRKNGGSTSHNSRAQLDQNDNRDYSKELNNLQKAVNRQNNGSFQSSSESHPYLQKESKKTLDGFTARSLQVAGTVSSVQDVSDTKQIQNDEDFSSRGGVPSPEHLNIELLGGGSTTTNPVEIHKQPSLQSQVVPHLKIQAIKKHHHTSSHSAVVSERITPEGERQIGPPQVQKCNSQDDKIKRDEFQEESASQKGTTTQEDGEEEGAEEELEEEFEEEEESEYMTPQKSKESRQKTPEITTAGKGKSGPIVIPKLGIDNSGVNLTSSTQHVVTINKPQPQPSFLQQQLMKTQHQRANNTETKETPVKNSSNTKTTSNTKLMQEQPTSNVPDAEGELDERSMQQLIFLESTDKSKTVFNNKDSCSDTTGDRAGEPNSNGEYQTKRLFNPTNNQKQVISEKFSELRAQERQPQKHSSQPEMRSTSGCDDVEVVEDNQILSFDQYRHSAGDGGPTDDKDQQIDFVLSSNSPYRLNSGRCGAPPGTQGLPSNDSGSVVTKDGNENAMIYSNFAGYNTQIQYGSGDGASRAQSLQNISNNSNTQNQGRAKKVISPVDMEGQPSMQQKAASSKKQDTYNGGTTDSDFFTLTAEDGESQMDPILIMKNLSNLNSGSTLNGGGIQEIMEEPPASSGAKHNKEITANSHLTAPMIREKDTVILSEEKQISDEQLVVDNNRSGRFEINKDHAHIKEFTPIALNDEKSFQNTDEADEESQNSDEDEYYSVDNDHETKQSQKHFQETKNSEISKNPVKFMLYQEDELVEVKSEQNNQTATNDEEEENEELNEAEQELQEQNPSQTQTQTGLIKSQSTSPEPNQRASATISNINSEDEQPTLSAFIPSNHYQQSQTQLQLQQTHQTTKTTSCNSPKRDQNLTKTEARRGSMVPHMLEEENPRQQQQDEISSEVWKEEFTAALDEVINLVKMRSQEQWASEKQRSGKQQYI